MMSIFATLALQHHKKLHSCYFGQQLSPTQWINASPYDSLWGIINRHKSRMPEPQEYCSVPTRSFLVSRSNCTWELFVSECSFYICIFICIRVYTGRTNFLFNSHLEGLVGGGRKSAAMEDARCSSSRHAGYHTPALHCMLGKHPSRSMPPATRPIQVRLPLLTKLEIEAQVLWLKQKPLRMAERQGGSESFWVWRNHTLLLLLCDSWRMIDQQQATSVR